VFTSNDFVVSGMRALSSSTTPRCLRAARAILLGLSLATMFCSGVAGQSQKSITEAEVWPEVDAHVQLPSHFRTGF